MVLLALRAWRDRKVLWGHRGLRVRLVLQARKGKLDCRGRQGRKEYGVNRVLLGLLVLKVSKVPPDRLEQLEQPQTCAPSMPLVKRSHARRTKQSCLQFAKVAAADRLCRMAPFDVLAPAELLDFASEITVLLGCDPGQFSCRSAHDRAAFPTMGKSGDIRCVRELDQRSATCVPTAAVIC